MANVLASARQRGLELEPLRSLWRGLTSVRFALAIIATLATLSLVGIVIPQLPLEMRANPAAVAAWLDFQEGRFGFLTDSMYRLGLFTIFRSIWFTASLGLLVVSVCVCTANRLPPIWRNVVRPHTRVPDDYFEHGEGVSAVTTADDAETLAQELRRRRYRVTLTNEGTATYLFADRFPWAQLATFVSHLALILFLAGGLVTLITAREFQVFVAEGEPAAPVFNTTDRDHMQVYVEDAVGRFDETGFPLDFRTRLVVYQGGVEVASGVTTVNAPLSYGGYKFHQAAYFPDGAALRVRDLTTGRLVYDEVMALTSSAATPRIVVSDATGNVLVDDTIVPTDFLGEVAGTLIVVPGSGREFWIGARPGPVNGSGASESGWQLVVFETIDLNGARAVMTEGETLDFGNLAFSYTGVTTVPSLAVAGLPGAAQTVVAELSDGPAGPLLTIGPVQGRALALSSGEPVAVGGYEYSFAGVREFSGLIVRRDRGASFIWLATGLLLLGLVLTFYTPRRRLWGKITAGQAAFRGLGGRHNAIEREIGEIAARAAASSPGTSHQTP